MANDILNEDDEYTGEDNDNEIVIVTDDSDDEDQDERILGNDANDDERAAIRERRRKEKLERKDRKDTAIKRDKMELDFLRKRNDDLERRLTAQETRAQKSDINNIDSHLQQAVNEVHMAERVIEKAVDAGNGADVAQAIRLRDQAIARAKEIHAIKQQAERQSAPQQPSIDELTMFHAREFMEDHKWYDASGDDEDSAVVLAIDKRLAKEGLDSRTEEYWDELRNRIEKRLPHKFGRQAGRTPRGGPNVGSGREHAPTSTRKEIYISPERKQALMEAGVWDDATLRNKYVKRYAEYDRKNKN
jgi:hypothetical protein